jgi:hypothetical protein
MQRSPVHATESLQSPSAQQSPHTPSQHFSALPHFG